MYFGHLIFLLIIALCDGTDMRNSGGRHSIDLTEGGGVGSRKETHAEYRSNVDTGIVPGRESSAETGNADDRVALNPDRNPSTSAGDSPRRFPKHATTHTGTTKQGQRVTVTKWYLDHNGKRVNRTSGSSFSRGVGSRQSSGQRTRSRQRGVYPGRYVRTGSQARSGVSSTRRASVPRRRTYIPRTRTALEGRTVSSPVYDGPVQKSNTYVYPFAVKYPHGQPIGGERTDNRGRTYTKSERHRTTARRIPIVSSHQRSPSHQNLGSSSSSRSRGSETQALSSGVDTQQQHTSRYNLQPRPRESPITPDATQRLETPYSSNSSVTSSLNRQRSTQRRTWGRIRDPSRFDPKTINSHRTSSATGPDTTSSRQSYRQSNGYRRTPSRNYQSTVPIYDPSRAGNTYSSHGSRVQYPSPPNAQKPQVQRTFRRNRVSSGYARYPSGSYSQRNPFQGRSSGSLFTSYDVVDDGECPNTGIDLRINGLGCQQAVQSYGQYLCYLHEYTSKECCETCIHRKRPDQVGCEYGDHARLCNSITPSDCYDRRNEMSCCKTCARFKKVGAPEMCQWGDMIGSQRCDEVRRNPGLCYMPDNARLCCETCNLVKNTTSPSCPWGDQNARMCQIFGPTGNVLINCYSPYRRRLCCDSCERLKQWLPTNMPADCEYGDRPVIFNTGQFGRVNCAQILKYVSVDQCRDNPVISKNCCYTCQRYLNTTSASAF